MKHLISSLITVATTVVPIFTVAQFEQRTSLSSLWDRPENRQLIEARIRVHQTSFGDFSEAGYTSNVRAIDDYSAAYKCNQKISNTGCKSQFRY